MVIDLRTARFLFDKYSIFGNVGRFIKKFLVINVENG